MAGRFVDVANKIKAIFLDGLFPETCLGCPREGVLLCERCEEKLSFSPIHAKCLFCEMDSIGGEVCSSCRISTSLDGCISLAPYANRVVREAIGRWKYNGNAGSQSLLFAWLEKSRLWNLLPSADWTIEAIPLHPARKRERGFNQADRLAEEVSRLSGYPYSSFLTRSRWTDPQAQRKDRQLGELDGCFSMVSQHSLPKYILLCDDVVTSGSTMDAAAKALKEAGVEKVWGLTLARGSHQTT